MATLEQHIMAALKQAMISKNETEMNALRAIKAAILLEKTSGKMDGEDLSAEQELSILQKLLKQRQDALAIFTQQKRDDLANKEKIEIALIERFLPERIDPEVAKEKIKAIIATTGASSIKDMGKVMGLATKELAGGIDNKSISEIIKSLLGA